MDTDIDARVPMLRMYSRCTGDTLRSAEYVRSSACGPRTPSRKAMGTGV
jgi:hypothetical protein